MRKWLIDQTGQEWTEKLVAMSKVWSHGGQGERADSIKTGKPSQDRALMTLLVFLAKAVPVVRMVVMVVSR